MTKRPSIREMHEALLASDSSYDGIFFFGVRTTSVFCRPSCRARKPNPENLVYFGTAREALHAGYRPCKRCKPLAIANQTPEWVALILAQVDDQPCARISDDDLRDQGIDPVRARRYFLHNFGMTFQAYCRARRMGTAFEQIRNGAAIDDVVLGNGYESSSGFRDTFAKTFGLPPGRSSVADCIRLTWIESPLGPLLAGADDKGICLLEFTGRQSLESQVTAIRGRFPCAVVPGENNHLGRLMRELEGYFASKIKQFTVPLIYSGTPFQTRVWEGLLRIPYGHTWSYEELARHVGSPKAQRAVGMANGRNPIAILIPCHRVVNKGGKLGGYGGGLWRKQFLLDLEQKKL